MVFASPFFLFGFLPVTLLAYFFAPARAKTPVLLLASLIFYAAGEFLFVLLMLASITMNYVMGRLLDYRAPGIRKLVFTAAIALNLLPLFLFKYSAFLSGNLLDLLQATGLPGASWEVPDWEVPDWHLPLGISFYTFQAMSYLFDVYRGQSGTQRSFINLALYIALFPQLIAGPIVRYGNIADQIIKRHVDTDLFFSGLRRFIFGLSKKLLIANNVALVADQAFAGDGQLGMAAAWIGLACYTIQIYFDFSGYSDMAIGLGRMFGFRLQENFNYPYAASSIKDFWRRWHISLSSWFRDYLYIPLGGSRGSAILTYRNLLIVFILCGLWHGASWTFLIWGLYHGALLVAERLVTWRAKGHFSRLGHLYAVLAAAIGWVFFRADSPDQALNYLASLVNFTRPAFQGLPDAVNNLSMGALALGMLFALPVYRRLSERIWPLYERFGLLHGATHASLLGVLFFGCLISVAGTTYNPFIYFRF